MARPLVAKATQPPPEKGGRLDPMKERRSSWDDGCVRRIPCEDRQVTVHAPGEPIMLYVGIDQHRKQLTVSIRDESGDVVLRRQVSTQWDKVRAFFTELRDRAAGDGGYVAIVEVCGFNHWLLKLLPECG